MKVIKISSEQEEEQFDNDGIIKLIISEYTKMIPGKYPEKTIHYKEIAKRDYILELFDKYKKSNNIEELTEEDKIHILKNAGFSDEDIQIILQQL